MRFQLPTRLTPTALPCPRLAIKMDQRCSHTTRQILAAPADSVPKSVADVIRIMLDIEATCSDRDGLKWFELALSSSVTQAVEARIFFGRLLPDARMACSNSTCSSACLYFGALSTALSSRKAPDSLASSFSKSRPCRDRGAFSSRWPASMPT